MLAFVSRIDTTSIRYPADLPISRHRDELLRTVAQNQVVVVAGETGSGKSTQLPKLCLEVGAGDSGTRSRPRWIGHTQPRRIAARSIAERVAEELGTKIGDAVGYRVRFTDRVGATTRIKLMTDGILLAEVQRDQMLSRYGALIIDEAHERSLNIDFLLGYLKALLPRRPDLKLIVTSATIDTARFAEHFASPEGRPAPVVEVSGRAYPVEIRYRPLDDGMDMIDGIQGAVAEVEAEGPGDVLVFLPGERDIRDTADALAESVPERTEIVPLFSRLSAAEQHRIFAPHRGRRIVLATNIAETSLTVPGIRFVIDPGLARISRYNQRTKVQRLPIEEVSQASAEQRAGRCGRLGPGLCIRLYGEEDFAGRPPFTDPEIMRTNLASVVLQMVSSGIAPDGLDDVLEFPFVETPDVGNISDGVRLLVELGALDPEPDLSVARPWLTSLGRRLARLPVDPRLARMILAGDKQQCLDAVLVVTAALSIQDPREEPTDQAETARRSHARHQHKSSDILTILNLWHYVRTERRRLSSSAFRRLCRREFLHHNRVREWQDLYAQLKRAVRDLELAPPRYRPPEDLDGDSVHRAVLAGLLGQIGKRDESRPARRTGRQDRRRSLPEYLGPRSTRFVIAPGSAARSTAARWVMAGELVETSRLFARMVAPIQPGWIEDAAHHLIDYRYTDPSWDRDRGTATVVERATLYGLSIVDDRRINLDRVDESLARQLFIEHALVRHEWDPPEGSRLAQFVSHNRAVTAAAERWDAKLRRNGAEDRAGAMFDHFDRRIPDHVVSVRHFERWWRTTVDRQSDLLDLSVADLVPDPAAIDGYPDRWPDGGADLRYTFDPESPVDGITVTLLLAHLPSARAAPFSWLVPGVRAELVTELLRTLPRGTRTLFAPLPRTATAIAERLPPWPPSNDLPIEEAVRRQLLVDEVPISQGLLDPTRLPDRLRPTFQVVAPDGTMLAAGKDLDRLQDRMAGRIRDELAATPHPIERAGLHAWPGGTIPRQVESEQLGVLVPVFPALDDRGDSVALTVVPTAAEQTRRHWAGVRRLLRFGIHRPARSAAEALTREATLATTVLAGSPDLHLGMAAVIDDLVTAVLDRLIASAGGAPWTAPQMRALERYAADRYTADLRVVADAVSAVLETASRIVEQMRGLAEQPSPIDDALDDVSRQLRSLVFPGSFAAQGSDRLPHVRRYLLALEHRLGRLPAGIDRDRQHMAAVAAIEADLGPDADPELRWMLQEYRVSLWAQHLGTDGPISPQRIRRHL